MFEVVGMPGLLDYINNANDIKNIKPQDYKRLAREIRSFLIEKVSKTGGHLASNLGVVELTMALHLFLDFPKDKLIWDVGHQTYTHKLLTGRKDQFDTLRQMGGISGFPKRKESPADAFDTGHSSTAISVALGMVKARDLKGEDNKVVAVLGDGALTGGLAFEALNNAGRLKTNMIIVLNDNNMSISRNVGGMANYLAKLRTSTRYTEFKANMENTLVKNLPGGKEFVNVLKRSKDAVKYLMLPNMFFEDMGLTYIGPIDGHNVEAILSALQTASRTKKAVVVHVITKKGKGYMPAENNPSKFHGISPFCIDNGEPVGECNGASYTQVFASSLVRLARQNEKIVAITAAMPYGTGLSAFKKHFPDRFFDVGIAEGHAVTFAAGLAAEGFRPVVAVYSTFLQRAYDQIVHDVCLNRLPVVFAVDRAGIVGRDGETHQGTFDLSYLSHIPNMVVMAPKNKWELDKMLEFALSHDGPVAIRYPKGEAYRGLDEHREPIIFGKSEIIYKEKDIAILAVGSMVETAVSVVELLNRNGKTATLVNARFVSPVDEEMLEELARDHVMFVTMEDNVRIGGYGQQVSDYICRSNKQGIRHLNFSVPECFVEQGGVEELYEKLRLDAKSIIDRILDEL